MQGHENQFHRSQVMNLWKFAASLALAIAAPAFAQVGAADLSQAQTIIDVRTPEEFAAGHVQGALNIPYERIGTGIAAVPGIGKDSALVLYCRSGRRSGIAKNQLESLGYRRVVNAGGINSLAKTMKVCSAPTC
jgi:phage shock protein E